MTSADSLKVTQNDDGTFALEWDKEDPNTIYHQFETKEGPNRIVKDDQIIKLALHYV